MVATLTVTLDQEVEDRLHILDLLEQAEERMKVIAARRNYARFGDPYINNHIRLAKNFLIGQTNGDQKRALRVKAFEVGNKKRKTRYNTEY